MRLWCKSDDQYSPAPGTALQGNKVRKLAGFLEAALAEVTPPLLVSFGGAYSNHLSALATAGRIYGLPVVLYVRGEEVDNPVLRQAERDGADLRRLTRTDYRLKDREDWLLARRRELAAEYRLSEEQIWFLPEGGSCPGAIRSLASLYPEIVAQHGGPPDYLCLSAGTGGTAAGLIATADPRTHIEVFPALRGDWMTSQIRQWLPPTASPNWTCITDYHYGGYGKFPPAWRTPSPGLATRAELGEPGLPPLEPIYTAKLFAGVLDRLRQGRYPAGSRVVVLHTGGVY